MFLDEVIPARNKQIKALDKYATCCAHLGHAFGHFSFQFDAMEEGTTTSEFMHSLSDTSAFFTGIRASSGTLVCLDLILLQHGITLTS